IQFENGSEFSATNPEQPILDLTGFPTGLGLGSNPGAITVNGQGNQITPSEGSNPTFTEPNGSQLSVSEGETLALIGNGINLNSATLNGQIELGSINTGLVNIQDSNSGLTFDYDNITRFSNIDIQNQTVINGSNDITGNINLTGANIQFLTGSLVLIQNQQQAQGTLSINATESVVLRETSFDGQVSSSIQTQTLGSGRGTTIEVTTPRLSFADGARIQAATYSEATGGDVNVITTESVELLPNTSANPNRPSGLISGLGTTTFADGQAGNNRIDTPVLRVFDGGIIAASTTGNGAGGNLTVNAKTIELSGINQNRGAPSAIGSTAFSSGDSGSVVVNADNITLSEGGSINTSSIGSGNGGTLFINAQQLSINSGSSVSAASVSGTGGNINLNSDNLQLDNGSQITAEAGNEGDGGNITINTSNLTAKKTVI
ncbi:MAG: hypothetical protein ACRDBG_24675, partial [Waterburya sp.]